MTSNRNRNRNTENRLKLFMAFACGASLTYFALRQSFRQRNEEIEKVPKKKPTRIYLDGCWDVMHSGHYNAIRQAKALGDILVVGVHSDQEIALNKREPIMKNEERLAAVRACKWVDEVVFDVPYAPTNQLLDNLNCDYCAHGDDMPVKPDGTPAYGEVFQRLKIFRRTPGVSTTQLIQRLLNATEEEQVPQEEREPSPGAQSFQDDEGSLYVSWSSFLASSTRISAFSNHNTPSKNDTVVYIDGIFDLFHVGHIAALKAAAELGTFLYVGLFDDSVIRARKGEHFPLMGIQERVLNVLSCKYVDEVLIGAPWKITEETITSLNISHVVITRATSFAENEMDRYKIPKQKGILRRLETESEFTTPDLMKRIRDYHCRITEQNKPSIEKFKKYSKQRKYIKEK